MVQVCGEASVSKENNSFPSSPVAETLSSQDRGARLGSWSEN